MRASLIALILVTTLSSVWLAIWYVNRSNSGATEPPIDIAPIPAKMAVLAGANEDLELVLRPFLPEEGQDAFNRQRLDELLGLKNPNLDYLRLWLVNRTEKTLPLDLEALAEFSFPGQEDWRAQSLAALLREAQARRPLSRSDAFVLEGLARKDLRELEPRAFVEIVVALPRDPDWRKLPALEVPYLPGLTLMPAEVRASALDEFVAKPQGAVLDRLIFPAESSDLQASRK